jgi:flagellar biosynthesis protein FlhF
MQVKKFEAPTIQEALEHVKRELGPEAIILQTKKYKRGFGLMSKASVEITAAVSDRSLHKKQWVEARVPDPSKSQMTKLSAGKQADLMDQYMEKHLQKVNQTQERVEVSSNANNKRITATRYIDIPDDQYTKSKAPPAQERPAAKSPAAPTQTSFQAAVPPAVSAPVTSPASAPARPTNGMSLEEEVLHLKKMIEEIKISQDQAGSKAGARGQSSFQQTALENTALHDAFEQLIVNGVDRRYALPLIKKVGFELGSEKSKNPEWVLDQMAVELMESVEVLSPLSKVQKDRDTQNSEYPTMIALIGPTGVGKTTTLAKVASEALLKRGLKVGLINLDNYKLTAFDQLGTYAKILKIPFRSATSIDDLKAAILDFKSCDLVLVDTTGRSQRDPSSLKEMQEILQSIPELSTYIVLSATTRDAELYDAASRFATFRPQGMIISKLDEATVYGGIYNVSQRVKLPLLYFTTGQKIPDDLEEATRERVAALILDI